MSFLPKVSYGQLVTPAGSDSLFLFDSKGALIHSQSLDLADAIGAQKKFFDKWLKKYHGTFLVYYSHFSERYVFYSKNGFLQDSISKEIEVLNTDYLVLHRPPYKAIYSFSKNERSAWKYINFKWQDGVLLGKSTHHFSVLESSGTSSGYGMFVDALFFLDNTMLACRIQEKWGVYNLWKQRFLALNIFDSVFPIQDSLIGCVYKGKVGVLNRAGRYVLAPVWDTVGAVQPGLIFAGKRKDGAWSFTLFSVYGTQLFTSDIQEFKTSIPESEVVFLKRNDKWGIYSVQGQEIIPPYYDRIHYFHYGLAVVQKGIWYGIVDTKGIWIEYPTYRSIMAPCDSFWVLTGKENCTIFHAKTLKRYSVSFQQLEYAGMNYFKVYTSDGKIGLINAFGKTIIEPKYDRLWVETSMRTIVAGQKNYYSLFYANGNLKVFMNYPFTRFDTYVNGLAIVEQKGKKGFINADGLLVVSTQYDSVRAFQNGRAAVCIAGKWGFVDKDENIIVSPYYDKVGDFLNENCTWFLKAGKIGFFDIEGKEIIGAQYDAVQECQKGYFLVQAAGRWGLVDATGIQRVAPAYKYLRCIGGEKFIYRLYNKYGLLEPSGRPWLPDVYDEIEAFGPYLLLKKQYQWEPVQFVK